LRQTVTPTRVARTSCLSCIPGPIAWTRKGGVGGRFRRMHREMEKEEEPRRISRRRGGGGRRWGRRKRRRKKCRRLIKTITQ
jgi:hypothetical protein